jgi:hypothetical protein
VDQHQGLAGSLDGVGNLVPSPGPDLFIKGGKGELGNHGKTVTFYEAFPIIANFQAMGRASSLYKTVETLESFPSLP